MEYLFERIASPELIALTLIAGSSLVIPIQAKRMDYMLGWAAIMTVVLLVASFVMPLISFIRSFPPSRLAFVAPVAVAMAASVSQSVRAVLWVRVASLTILFHFFLAVTSTYVIHSTILPNP